MAQGPTIEEQVYTLNSQMTEIQNTNEALTKKVNDLEECFDQKLDVLSTKIDETLSDSINILKNDYEKKVNEVQRQLEDFKQETRLNQENIERRLEQKLMSKINEVNDNLIDQMKTIYHSSQKNENMLMKKIDNIELSIKGVKESFDAMTIQVEDCQEKMYDFEQNKKNNLIFYGIPGDVRETKDDLKHKISSLLKLRLNIRREISILRASRMLTGKHPQQRLLFETNSRATSSWM